MAIFDTFSFLIFPFKRKIKEKNKILKEKKTTPESNNTIDNSTDRTEQKTCFACGVSFFFVPFHRVFFSSVQCFFFNFFLMCYIQSTYIQRIQQTTDHNQIIIHNQAQVRRNYYTLHFQTHHSLTHTHIL